MSALQARRHAPADASVYIVSIAKSGSPEADVFRAIAARNGIEFVDADLGLLGGLHPMYARLFLDHFLPDDVEELLYLDGDTQVLGDLEPLLRAQPPVDGVLAVKDPMVFIRTLTPQHRTRIEGWWDEGGIPASVRDDYVNSGVLRISRSSLPALRARCAEFIETGRATTFHFHDQDAINVASEGRIETVPMTWNYPGFLMSTPIEQQASPRIVHFMSNPRPWNAPLEPWGRDYYDPYEQFVAQYPDAAPFWDRMTGVRLVKYRIQQLIKRVTEQRIWSSPAASAAVRKTMRGSVDPLA